MVNRALPITAIFSGLLGSQVSAQSFSPVVFPTNDLKVSSPFGSRIHPVLKKGHIHSGIDIPSSYGSKVRAVQNGQVIFAGKYGGYGDLVTITHESHTSSLYGHLSKINVSVGDLVSAGQIIGEVGDSGRTTGTHLHFEIRVGGVPINPEEVWGD